jgi:adenylosuccinate lyase
MPDQEIYQSAFSWRYGSAEMRSLWSEAHKRRLWRRIWLALAEAQAEYGLASAEQVAELACFVDQIDLQRSLEIEAQIHHDLMAELKAYAEQAPSGGAALHLGATSTDIEDNADVLRMRQALDLVIRRLNLLLALFVEKIDQWAHLPLIAFTHLQPAEPSTLGYRFAMYTQDLLFDWEDLRRARRHLRGKGFKGAVGTGAAYAELLGEANLPALEARLSTSLGLAFFPVTAQTYPRKQDYRVISALAGLAGTLYKFAFDLRLLQSPPVGELSEPFGKLQVGSSAMPFKRNPINAEKIDSLARMLAQMPRIAWDNAAHSLLERTLDDSANRRSLLPESFLIADELLLVAERIVRGLKINELAVQRNLDIYGPFAASERVLMALSKAGADRQEMHEHLRQASMTAWESILAGDSNPLAELLANRESLTRYLDPDQIRMLMDYRCHLGDAPQRAVLLAQNIRRVLESSGEQID